MPITATEQAHRALVAEGPRVPGVLGVEGRGGHTLGEQTIFVFIRSGDIDTEYRVYDLKGSMYHRFPGARIDCQVEEIDPPGHCDRQTVSTFPPPL